MILAQDSYINFFVDDIFCFSFSVISGVVINTALTGQAHLWTGLQRKCMW